jgi:hypothetical protein
MELYRHRRLLGGVGAAIAFGLLVGWMVPPTKPQRVTVNWRAQIKPAAPPAPVPDALAAAPALRPPPVYHSWASVAPVAEAPAADFVDDRSAYDRSVARQTRTAVENAGRID